MLFLGGSDIQIPAIRKAQEMGAYVMTCDYLPDNPGHKIADAYYDVSTTDKEKVLELSKSLKIDGISAYAADPAALTAAYVSEKLGLPGNSFDSILKISDKTIFRKLQVELGIRCPKIIESADHSEIIEEVGKFRHGAIIKPVDTSGSKGIYRITADEKTEDLKTKIEDALSYSRVKRIVVEEYILRKGFLMSGDFLINNGRIDFYCFGDVHFNDTITGLVPRSISLPATNNDPNIFSKAINDLQKMIDRLNIHTGVFNCDIIEDQDGQPVIIDIGARNGGNLFNDIISLHKGIDLIGLSMMQTLGLPLKIEMDDKIYGYYAHNVLHSTKDGIFEGIEFDPEIRDLIFYKNITVTKGDRIHRFVNSGYRIGLILLKFEDYSQMHRILGNIYDYVFVNVSGF